ncbi:MAG: phosphoglycerate transporter [Clostridiales bacterium]|nr:MAG: phosphoglycerate transporter [Clostridiales bacterium]
MKKVGIICAADDELAPFLPHIDNCTISEKAMLKFYQGQVKGVPVVALYSGVCKVNAAIAAQILIDSYHVEIVVNAGVAGGIDPKIQLFDTVVSTRAVYHDVEEDILTGFHPWMSSVYFAADEDLLNIAKRVCRNRRHVHFGGMATGEQFIQDDLRESINEKFSPLSVDMETASIAHVCYVNEVPFIAIRSITDTADHAGVENFEKNCKEASMISKEVVLDFLDELRKQWEE